MIDRAFPHVDVRRLVVNQSDRAAGSKLSLIVLHDTEGGNVPGVADLIGLGAFFDVPSHEASSHVATDAEGNSARFVRDAKKAWHCAGFNSVSLGIEQVGFATTQHWPDAQLRETARWVAYWSRRHGIPIQRGKVSGSHVLVPGVVTHMQLGAFGGGHHDPGDPYPVDHVLWHARRYRAQQQAAKP